MSKYLWAFLLVLLLSGCAITPEPIAASPAEWGAKPEYAKAVYEEGLELLSKGRQQEAEYLMDDARVVSPDSQRLHFLSAVLWRSRFENKNAHIEFGLVYKLDETSPLAELSQMVVAMDAGLAVEQGFEMLAAQDDDILVKWLYCMEARFHSYHVQEAGKRFRSLFKEWEVGPVMAHQTYAKLLTTDLGEPEKALEHRYLAVELEPEPWSYQGLANTFKALDQYQEADQVYGKLLEMKPYNSIYWIQWGTCRFYMKDYAGASTFFSKAYVLNPKDVNALIFLGRCLERQGRLDEGYAKYEEALRQNPKNVQAKAYVAHAKLYGYGTDPDFEAALESCTLPGRPAMAQLRDMVKFADTSENPIAPENSATLLPLLKTRAKAGNAGAGYNLGMIYRYGIGVPASEVVAMEWFRMATAHGHTIAQREINPPE